MGGGLVTRRRLDGWWGEEKGVAKDGDSPECNSSLAKSWDRRSTLRCLDAVGLGASALMDWRRLAVRACKFNEGARLTGEVRSFVRDTLGEPPGLGLTLALDGFEGLLEPDDPRDRVEFARETPVLS